HQGEQQRADAQPGPRGAGESARGRCGRFRRTQRRGRVRLRQRRGVRRVEVRVVGTPVALTGRGVHPSYLVLVRNSGAGAVAPRPTLELTWVPTRVPAPLPTDPLTEPLIEAVGGGGGDCGPTGAPARAVKPRNAAPTEPTPSATRPPRRRAGGPAVAGKGGTAAAPGPAPSATRPPRRRAGGAAVSAVAQARAS